MNILSRFTACYNPDSSNFNTYAEPKSCFLNRSQKRLWQSPVYCVKRKFPILVTLMHAHANVYLSQVTKNGIVSWPK